MSRILILSSGNTFTHVLEGKSTGFELEALGHEVIHGISKHYTTWAEQHKIRHYIVPDLWERGPVDHPNVSWFIDHDYILRCVHEEIHLIQRLKPDYVLANFKYTSRISTGVTGTPLISMNILSMLPETKANFGYLQEDTSPESRQQQHQLNFFDTFACYALNSVAKCFALKPLAKMSDYLDGDWVLIPDSPWFNRKQHFCFPEHYTPINFLHREKTSPELQAVETWSKTTSRKSVEQIAAVEHRLDTIQQKKNTNETIFLALGSICRSQKVLVFLISALCCEQWKLYVSISGKNDRFLNQLKQDFPTVTFAEFYDIQQLAKGGLDLYVCQGGLGSIFTGLQYSIPTLIVPLQPEQDHNGMLVEQHGIGARLWPSCPFSGKEDFYIQRLLQTHKTKIRETVRRMVRDQSFDINIRKARRELLREVSSFPGPAEVIQKIINGHSLSAAANSDMSVESQFI